MRNLSCCCLLFHFFFFILFFLFMLLLPNVAVAVPVPVPFASSSSSSSSSPPLPSRILSLNHTKNNGNSGECDALLHFINSFDITGDVSSSFCGNTSYAKASSWKKGGRDCCRWDGVTCDPATSHVIGLDLSCSGLVGQLHSNSSLFSLPNLRRLNLAYNNFYGSPVPSKFGIFKEMTHLNLSHSGFTGLVALDRMISHLSELISLDLSSYFYTSNYALPTPMEYDGGDLGRVLQNLTQLRELVLDRVDMSGVSPAFLGNLSSTVTTLSLPDCNLQGPFPIDIFHLPNLQNLDLSENSDLTGNLEALTNWSGPLVSLDLSWTNLQWPIPASIGNLASMKHLDLSGSSFVGPIPPTLVRLAHHLIFLDLSYNNFSRTVDLFCDKNCSMPRLQHLSLRSCGLTRFPNFLSSSAELIHLDLSGNTITGPIPDWFWRVGRDTLDFLELSSNNFIGDIPPSICQMRSLTFLDLSYNALGSTLPGCLGNLSTLTQLDLSINSLHGPLPRSLSNCTSLLWLHLQSNEFHGSVAEIALPSGLTQFIVSNNSFQGQLPYPPPTIQNYLASNNKFTGNIPHRFCNVTYLQAFDLSNNHLAGSIPQCFRNLSDSLRILDVRANKIVGQVPDIFNHNCQLQSIRLSKNNMHGELPLSLANCSNLEVLDVSGNEIEGYFPYWLDTLPNLHVLSLRSNRFYGLLGTSEAADLPFPELRIFDLSNNSFSGPLPINYIANFTAMKSTEFIDGDLYMESSDVYYEESIQITVKGSEIQLERILNIFTTIDFSGNAFDEDIPNVIGDLQALKGLNLSHNNLIGIIPSSLGNLTNLEWLDLSSNKLHGDIPGELALLSSLGTLNLSNNQLVGRIPQSRQFDTFTSDSFGGNPGLCGHPLPKSCENDAGQTPSSTSQEEEEHDSNTWIEWRAILMGYGCGLAFAISAWYVMMETRRPWWLVGTIESWLLRIVEGKRLGRKTRRQSNNIRRRTLTRRRT